MNNWNNNIYIRDKGKLLYLSNSITKKSFTFKSSPFEQRLELSLSFEHRLRILLWELPCLLLQLPHSLKISNSTLNKYSNSFMHNSNLIYTLNKYSNSCVCARAHVYQWVRRVPLRVWLSSPDLQELKMERCFGFHRLCYVNE